jgi:phosphoribosylglycinamide formyltransferase-1
MLRIAFLASNNGTAMRAVIEAIDGGVLAAEPCLISSNKKSSPALQFAAERNFTAMCIPTQGVEDDADRTLLNALNEERADHLVLSGYLRKLGPRTLSAFNGQIINIHPALLPKFGGVGMYGRRVHDAVIQAGETVSGATVHLVDPEYDQGRIIAIRSLPIGPREDAASLERKVMDLECALLVETLREIADGHRALPL